MRKVLFLALLLSSPSFATFKGDLKADTAAVVKMCIALVADAEPATALDIDQADVRLSKNGGNMAQKSDTTANAAHDEIGCYDLTINTTDTNTEGSLDVCVDEAATIRQCDSYMVLSAAYYDMKYGATTLLTTRDTGLMLLTTVASVTSQTVLVLTAGASNNDAYGVGSSVQILGGTEECEASVADYVGSTTTLTLAAACPFTVAAADIIRVRGGASGPSLTVVDSVVDATLSVANSTFSGLDVVDDKVDDLPQNIWDINCEDQGGAYTCQETMSLLLSLAWGRCTYTAGTRTFVCADPSGTENRGTIIYGTELDGDRTSSTPTPMTP